jgi:hypothetical protein
MFERESNESERQLGETPRSRAEAGAPARRPDPPSSNRPAQNARVGSPSELGDEWRGGEGATDFLGLDQELFGVLASPVGTDQSYGLDPTPLKVEDASIDPDSWLHEVDDLTIGAQLDPELELPDQLEASWSDPDNKPSKVGPYLLRGMAAVCVIAVGFTLVRLFTAAPEPDVVERGTARGGDAVARGDQTGGELTGPDLVTMAPTGDDTTAIPRERFVPPRFDPTASADDASRAVRDAQVGRVDPSTVSTDLEPIPPESVTGPGAVPFDDVAAGGPEGATTDPGPLALGPRERSGLGEAPGGPGTLRYATAEDMAGIWEGTAIPLDSIDGAERIVTPFVGRVRAVLDSGEVFEGRLYAVGERRIWLDTSLGRMALAGRRLSKIDHVLSPDGAPVLGDPGSIAYAGLPRVRVRVPGGMFFGKLIDEQGDEVVLITEEGARITLKGADIEPAPLSKRVVVKGYVDEMAGG